jgi:hypothetical protein
MPLVCKHELKETIAACVCYRCWTLGFQPPRQAFPPSSAQPIQQAGRVKSQPQSSKAPAQEAEEALVFRPRPQGQAQPSQAKSGQAGRCAQFGLVATSNNCTELTAGFGLRCRDDATKAPHGQGQPNPILRRRPQAGKEASLCSQFGPSPNPKAQRNQPKKLKRLWFSGIINSSRRDPKAMPNHTKPGQAMPGIVLD